MNLLIITSERLHPKNTFASIFELSKAEILKGSVSDLGILSVCELNLLNITYAIIKKIVSSGNEISKRFNYWQLFIFLIRAVFRSKTVVNNFKINNVDVIEAVGVTSLLSGIKTIFSKKSWVDHGLKAYDIFIEVKFVPNVIHAHSRFLNAGLLALSLKKRYGIPYVLTEHSSYIINKDLPLYIKHLLTQVYSNADRLIAVSNYLKFKIVQRLKYEGEIIVIPNILDEIYNSEIFNKKLIVEEFVFINVASLLPVKNHKLLIDAFSLFDDKNIRLIIVGDGPLMNQLKDYSNAQSNNGNISFVGSLDKSDVRKLLLKSNSFILTSKSETFGVVVIEALACGLPVVSTKCGGAEELINKSNGLIVEHDKTSIHNAMKSIINNIGFYDSVEIRQNCISNFGSEKVAGELLAVYQNVLNSKN